MNKKILFAVFLLHALVLMREGPRNIRGLALSHFGKEAQVSIRFRPQVQTREKNTSSEHNFLEQHKDIGRSHSETLSESSKAQAPADDEQEQGKDTRDSGIEHAIHQYISELRAIIEENKRYPPQAMRMRHEGETKVLISLSRTGEVIEMKIVKESGSAFLDKASLAAIGRTRKYPRVPENIAQGPFTVSFTLTYQL